MFWFLYDLNILKALGFQPCNI